MKNFTRVQIVRKKSAKRHSKVTTVAKKKWLAKRWVKWFKKKNVQNRSPIPNNFFVQNPCSLNRKKLFVQNLCPLYRKNFFVQNLCSLCRKKLFVQNLFPVPKKTFRAESVPCAEKKRSPNKKKRLNYLSPNVFEPLLYTTFRWNSSLSKRL